MHLPDYKGGGIVNLMSSIEGNFGKKHPYKQSKLLQSKELRNYKNIVLIIIDGLGYHWLQKQKSSFLCKGIRGKMTSVFPSTTASAITSFATGVAPQQHAYTGWYMNLKEIGAVTTILPFNARFGGQSLDELGVSIDDLLSQQGFVVNLGVSTYVVTSKHISTSVFARHIHGDSRHLPYNTLNGFFRQTRRAVTRHNRRKYIYAYWSHLDSLGHKFGINSRKVARHFKKIATGFQSFIRSLQGTDTAVIVTADHGQIDTIQDHVINLSDHPRLEECLTLPLCGGSRVVYCYVHPSKSRNFERYIKMKLGKVCHLFKSEELIRRGVFGLFKPNPKLFDRIGDYVLVMKEDYVLTDNLINKKRPVHIGRHGGVSKEEMYVPLIYFKT